MKGIVFATGLILLLAASAPAQEARPNFSGTWILDLEKSDFAQMPAPDSIVNVIDHKEPALKIATTQKGQQGEVTNERNLTTDGKENANKMRTMGGEQQEVKSTTKWVGRKLMTAFKLDVQGGVIEITDAWELSGDGKTMTVVRDLKNPQGELTQTIVFNKQ
jgi:hypothetical protein